VKKLGQTKRTPAPEDDTVEGRVTGIQKVGGGRERLMKAPSDGKLVAWSVKLSKPSKPVDDFFRAIFFAGSRSDPYGRIAVVRHVEGRKYKLIRQSPAVDLNRFRNERPVITLRRPLRMREGDLLALTIPTWLPAFAKISRREADRFGGKQANQWIASRPSDHCSPDGATFRDKKRYAQGSRPHKKEGSIRRYGCRYRGGRLLYWGYFVPD
jgi:hypothetical protein